MPETRLACLTHESARLVCEQANLASNPSNWARVEDPAIVVIRYADKRYPLDITEWAFDRGHASDDAASAVMASL